jgi:hypothetical protein
MAGTLALVGSGEFLDSMRAIDGQLLERVGGATQARMLIIPTASAPDGPQVFARWLDLGRAHFSELGRPWTPHRSPHTPTSTIPHWSPASPRPISSISLAASRAFC